MYAGTLLYETLSAPPREQPPAADTVVIRIHGDHEGDDAPNCCLLCSTFYNQYVALSDAAAAALSIETADQSSKLWLFSRKVRLTASNVAKVPKKQTTSGEKAATKMLCPVFSGNAATKHGKQMEPVARAQFSKQTGFSVRQVGTVVSKEFPWLSASPDGMIDSANAILEIKCPHVSDITQLVAHGKHDVRLSKDDMPVLAENGPNGYYSQVQFQLLCTKKSLCFFYLWSAQKDILIEVPFDAAYIDKNMPRLKKFYFSELLPRMVDMHNDGHLDVPEQYITICNTSIMPNTAAAL